jgi:antitoxin component of MazEF toxin-antitoxin module
MDEQQPKQFFPSVIQVGVSMMVTIPINLAGYLELQEGETVEMTIKKISK